ncbi:TetR/AcrR family transcriptional regulator [Oceanobacillus jordanicus]|uniref:TetR/AcrR family transcriptional regulator n=1 Tax=Oceanobacillus jordanicus TaxID=2867266 RepID=A0AAW5B778_9BACI|nr:TetR/AcrR family transcriptional regulator [Oceanobacillus jordanicus]MCG3419403.1 TetR/AcrR family transcriptional regulator [Oceanobacillus jordanicus]
MEKSQANRKDPEWTKSRILSVAQQLFMEKGYRAVTTREIAAQCEITQPALYYHYSDKQSLYIAMLERFVSHIQKRLRVVGDGTIAERLEGMLEVLSAEHPTSMMMMVHDILVEFKEENRKRIFSLWKETYLDPFIKIFEEMQEEEMLRESIQPEDAARFCLLTLGQTMSQWKQKPKTLAGQYSLLVDLILNGTTKS